MKKLLIVLIFLVITMPVYAQDGEEITLTTYFPAPYGDYNTLKAKKLAVGTNSIMPSKDGIINFSIIDDNASSPAGTEGSLYYSMKGSKFKYHDGSASNPWKSFSGSLPSAADKVAFRAYLGSKQDTTDDNTSFHKVNLDAEIYDEAGCFDTVNSRFRPTKKGIYYIYGQVEVDCDTGSDDIEFKVALYKNGVMVSQKMVTSHQHVQIATASIVDFIECNGVDDDIELWYWFNHKTTEYTSSPAGTKSIKGNDSTETYMCGYLIGTTS